MPNGLVPVRQALANSVPVATFGTGDYQVEVRHITPPPPPPGTASP
jgi:hypothetical protein